MILGWQVNPWLTFIICSYPQIVLIPENQRHSSISQKSRSIEPTAQCAVHMRIEARTHLKRPSNSRRIFFIKGEPVVNKRFSHEACLLRARPHLSPLCLLYVLFSSSSSCRSCCSPSLDRIFFGVFHLVLNWSTQLLSLGTQGHTVVDIPSTPSFIVILLFQPLC